MPAPQSTIHLPPGTLEEQALARLDRLALFVSARAELAHLTQLMREVERGKADLEESLPILDRSATRLARALHALGEK
jgi:hypothetical protein